MYGNSCHANGCGSFIMGTAAGMLAGVAVGTMMATPSRQIKRTAHKAARRHGHVSMTRPPAQAGGSVCRSYKKLPIASICAEVT